MATFRTLSTPGQLLKAAALSYERVRLHLAIVGVETGTTDPIQAYRSVAEQKFLFLRRYTTDKSQPLATPLDMRPYAGKRYYRRRGYAAAAVPGTSNHGNGNAVDFQGLGAYTSSTWKLAAPILIEHGWSNKEGRQVGEPWHWVYTGANDKHFGEDMNINVTSISDSVADKIAAAVIKKQNANAPKGYDDSSLARELVKACGGTEYPNPQAAFDPLYSQSAQQALLFLVKAAKK